MQQDGKVRISENLIQELMNYLLRKPCGEVIDLVNRLFIELKENESNGKSIS